MIIHCVLHLLYHVQQGQRPPLSVSQPPFRSAWSVLFFVFSASLLLIEKKLKGSIGHSSLHRRTLLKVQTVKQLITTHIDGMQQTEEASGDSQPIE